MPLALQHLIQLRALESIATGAHAVGQHTFEVLAEIASWPFVRKSASLQHLMAAAQQEISQVGWGIEVFVSSRSAGIEVCASSSC